jgi:hypothetical protein
MVFNPAPSPHALLLSRPIHLWLLSALRSPFSVFCFLLSAFDFQRSCIPTTTWYSVICAALARPVFDFADLENRKGEKAARRTR